MGSSRAMDIRNESSAVEKYLKADSKLLNKSKSGLEVLNEKEIIERVSHPNILECTEIIGTILSFSLIFKIPTFLVE
jgi:hypothetical protein